MKTLVGLFLGATLVLAPANKPTLKIKLPHLVFLPPGGSYQRTSVTVMATARLEGDPENAEEYYCLTELWEWGDEERSLYEPDCDPYEPGAELKRNFSATHRYRDPGSYSVVLRLERDEKTVLLGRANLLVRGD